ncbi:MAG: peptide deformylase [Ruminococcaceae bacterium]|nr:peptide deformylase [Oscillospiraceae bacterium]
MVREICKDIMLLNAKARAATADDKPIADDLLDTLKANSHRCVGMAANMIGKAVAIIAFNNEGTFEVMYNPEIIKREGAFDTEEGCLSLEGVRPCKRYRSIKVKYQNEKMQIRQKTYTGWTAQIIQHECDHLFGIII